MNKEKDTVSISFLYDFYNHYRDLRKHYSDYICIVPEMEDKYGTLINDADKGKWDEQDKNRIVNARFNVRFFAIEVLLSYKALKSEIKEFETNFKEIEEQAKLVKNNIILDEEATEKLIDLLSLSIMSGVLKQFFVNAEQIMSGILNN
jgi:hypothetical protein|tara:strand:- start:8993 stop:9436 length:444 start_codon:yes stop_codon:yes gene_type:complete